MELSFLICDDSFFVYQNIISKNGCKKVEKYECLQNVSLAKVALWFT